MNYKILIRSEQIKIIINFFEQAKPNETGGVLIGYWQNEIIIVSNIIGPGKNSLHTRFSFTPDNAYHLKKIEKYYQGSGRRHYYLGDWHTHPGAKAYLSKTDKTTLETIACYEPARIKTPIMIVLGTAPFEFKAWVYQSDEKITEAEIILS